MDYSLKRIDDILRAQRFPGIEENTIAQMKDPRILIRIFPVRCETRDNAHGGIRGYKRFVEIGSDRKIAQRISLMRVKRIQIVGNGDLKRIPGMPKICAARYNCCQQ